MTRFFLIFFLFFSLNGIALAAPAVVVKDLAGKTYHLTDYKGKWLIVNYWATWCPPCLEEVPDLIALYDQGKHKDIMVIGVALEYQTKQEVEKFVDDMLISYPVVLGNDKIVSQIGSAEVLPSTYIFSPEGQLIKTKRGLITKALIEKIISQHKP